MTTPDPTLTDILRKASLAHDDQVALVLANTFNVYISTLTELHGISQFTVTEVRELLWIIDVLLRPKQVAKEEKQ